MNNPGLRARVGIFSRRYPDDGHFDFNDRNLVGLQLNLDRGRNCAYFLQEPGDLFHRALAVLKECPVGSLRHLSAKILVQIPASVTHVWRLTLLVLILFSSLTTVDPKNSSSMAFKANA